MVPLFITHVENFFLNASHLSFVLFVGFTYDENGHTAIGTSYNQSESKVTKIFFFAPLLVFFFLIGRLMTSFLLSTGKSLDCMLLDPGLKSQSLYLCFVFVFMYIKYKWQILLFSFVSSGPRTLPCTFHFDIKSWYGTLIHRYLMNSKLKYSY